jgi:hypothetical protein
MPSDHCSCPASSSSQRFGSVKVGDRAVCAPQVDVEGSISGERLVWPDGLELDAIVLGMGSESQAVMDVLAIEPLLL